MTGTLANVFGDTLDSLRDRLRIDTDALTAAVGSARIEATSLSELRSELSAAIYTHLHVRHPGIDEAPTTGRQDLAEALIAGIPHRTVFQTAEGISAQQTAADGAPHRIVGLSGVKVLVPSVDVFHQADGEHARVRVPSWRTRTTPGFLLALGANGPVDPRAAERLYITCDSASEALEIWPSLLRALAVSGVSHQAKALSASPAFPRSDAVVVYVSASDAEATAAAIRPVVERLPHPETPVSVFGRPLAERVTTAQEPNDPRPSYNGLSFGQHRSRVLADALLRSSREGLPLRQAWEEEAQAAHIHPHDPGRTVALSTLEQR